MKDKLEDLVPWVTKLKDSLTAANAKDDREEERRVQLAKFASHRSLIYCHDKLIIRRSLDDIEKRAQALSKKGTMARVVDKTRDAAAVVELVDQLQKTIIIYQVCAKDRQIQAVLIRMMAAVSATIDPQSSRAIDGVFLLIVLGLELTGRLLIQDFV